MELSSLKQLLASLPFEALDYVVISLNLLIFLFASYIIKHSPKASNESRARKRTVALRAINTALFSIYAFTAFIQIMFGIEVSNLQQISQTGLTILIAYILMHYLQGWIVKRFGREREIEGVTRNYETYSSEMVGLIGLLLVSSVTFLVIINIWKLNDWLQATSVIGGILILLFAAKEYFLGDMIAGLMLHYNHSVEAGSVIRVKEYNIVGVVLRVTLSQTIIRDLLQKHEITLTNSKLRNTTLENISNCGSKGFRDYIDFNIGYEQKPADVEAFLTNLFEQNKEEITGLNADAPPKIVIVENGDHAVTWRMLYFVNSPYRIFDVKNALQTAALSLSQENQLGLNTPMTHEILSAPAPVSRPI